jgi:hypothetical protein
MTSADFLPYFSVCRQTDSDFVAYRKTSWDKLLRFRRVMPDLLSAVTVGFRAFTIHSSLALRSTALYQVSVCHYHTFDCGFLQICSHPQHPCHSLTLPPNAASTGTYTLVVQEYAQHTKNEGQKLLLPFVAHLFAFY